MLFILDELLNCGGVTRPLKTSRCTRVKLRQLLKMQGFPWGWWLTLSLSSWFTSFVCSPPPGEALTQSSLLEADGENMTTAVEPMNLHHAMLRSAGRASSQSGPEVTFYLVELSGHSLRWPLSSPIRIYFTVWFIEPTRQAAAFRPVCSAAVSHQCGHFIPPFRRGNVLPAIFTTTFYDCDAAQLFVYSR